MDKDHVSRSGAEDAEGGRLKWDGMGPAIPTQGYGAGADVFLRQHDIWGNSAILSREF